MVKKTRIIVLLATIFCLVGCDWKYQDSSYFSRHQLSLKGGEDSEADIFTYDLEEIYKNNNFSGLMNHFPYLGDKFFVAFLSDDCDICDDSRGGFIEFERKFNKNKSFMSSVDKKEEFHLVVINVNDGENNDEYSIDSFINYLHRHEYFFNKAGDAAHESNYYKNGYLYDSDVYALRSADEDYFLTPTFLLVEFGQKAVLNHKQPGVTEVMFDVNGPTYPDKAKFLLDCWNHTGPFGAE